MKVENTYKKLWGIDIENTPKPRTTNTKSSKSIFDFLQMRLSFTLYLTGIGLIYIWNAHFAERQAHYAEQLEQELKELKSEYMTLNAELSLRRTQSNIAVIVDSLGLKTLQEPPYKFNLKEEK